MDSRTFIDAIPDYLEGLLPETERRAFEQHQQFHPGDARYCEQYQSVIRACRSACAHDPSPRSNDAMVERIMAAWRKTNGAS